MSVAAVRTRAFPLEKTRNIEIMAHIDRIIERERDVLVGGSKEAVGAPSA